MRTVIRFTAVLAALLAALFMPALAEDVSYEDFAGQVQLDMRSDTAKQAVAVRTFVDGDTVHFSVPASVDPSGVLKARFIACNTPESTGKIEEWGKAASRFTREKLEGAEEILIESDTAAWNSDSTSTRYLVWVWYRPQGASDFRNLNIELLQEGLAIANSSAQNRYGETCMAAIAQARERKLRVYSGERDPDFFYGDAIELTLRELRLHPEDYDGKKVAFTGVITMNHGNAVFLEDEDEETGLCFGISAYYGFNMSGAGLEVLSVGNEARIVGTVQYYEAGEAWQVSGLTYRMMKPNDPGNIQIVSTGHVPAWRDTTPAMLNGTIAIDSDNGEPETYDYAELAQATSVAMNGLTVLRAREGSAEGSLWLTCQADGETVVVSLASGIGPSAEALVGKTIDLRGIVERHGGAYCVCVYTADGLTVRNDERGD